MKTIVAGTDFTPSSVNACRYGALLAQKLNCKLVIFNLYKTPVYHSNSGLIGITSPILKRGSKEGIEQVITGLLKDFPGLKISVLSSPGTLKGEMQNFISKYQVAAIVMGLEAKDKISKFIYGSRGVNIGGKLKAPVIIVPGKYTNHRLETLILAVDNRGKLDSSSLSEISKFVKGTQLDLKVLHVRTPEEAISPAHAISLKIGPTRKEIEVRKAATIEKGIKIYGVENKMDLIAIISKRHSIFYNLFNESATKRVTFASGVPVMAIHE